MRTEFPLPQGRRRPGLRRLAPHSGLLTRLAALAVSGLLVSACAASKGASDYQSYAGAPPARIAIATPPKPDLEADGLPAQLPPRRRANPQPIDPSEPFSPNYGPPPVNAPMAPEPERAPLHRAGYEPQADPVLHQVGPAKPGMSPAEADAVVARAVMAHEQRYP